LPGLDAGERLCKTFEVYRRVVPGSNFTMDQFILLTLSLAEGIEVELGQCAHCHGSLRSDRRPNERPLCLWCREAMLPRNRAVGQAILAAHAAQRFEDDSGSEEAYQQSLFLDDGRPAH